MLPKSYYLPKLGQQAIIRQATEQDFSGTWEIYRTVLSEGLYTPHIRGETSLDRYGHIFDSEDHEKRFITLICEVEGKCVGYASLEESIWDLSQHVGELGIAVLTEYRGLGIGSTLIESLVEVAVEKEFKKITLSVFHTNRRAIRLYRKLGFKKVGRKRKQFNLNGDYIDEIIMERFIDRIPN